MRSFRSIGRLYFVMRARADGRTTKTQTTKLYGTGNAADTDKL